MHHLHPGPGQASYKLVRPPKKHLFTLNIKKPSAQGGWFLVETNFIITPRPMIIPEFHPYRRYLSLNIYPRFQDFFCIVL